MPEPTIAQHEALQRLITVAERDTGQSRKVASFLLSWWNAGELGGFDLTDLWGVDTAIADDMRTVFEMIGTCHAYPDTLGYAPQFKRLVALWHPGVEAPGPSGARSASPRDADRPPTDPTVWEKLGWAELEDPREDIYTLEDGEPVPPPASDPDRDHDD